MEVVYSKEACELLAKQLMAEQAEKEIIYTKDGKRYEQKPWPKLITVKTHHNGYAVRVGENEYMYPDVPGLIKGLAVHSGFEHIGFVSFEELDRFLEGVCNGRALQNALTEIVELKRVISTLKKELKKLNSNSAKK